MSNSPLVDYVKLSPNHSGKRNHAIDTITIHCVAGNASVEALGSVFASAARKASSNYGIGTDGRIALYVDEENRSWCTSNASNDHRAITIEVANDGGAPDWHVSNAAMVSLINLLVDICRRNNIKQLRWKGDKSLIGQVSQQNMTVHRWFANKSCPGDYLYNLHGQIASEVNQKLGGGTVPTDTPSTAFSPYQVKVTSTTLRIRRGPGTNTENLGYIKPGVYTIVSEATGTGATKWGKLKSGVGWVSLDYAKKV